VKDAGWTATRGDCTGGVARSRLEKALHVVSFHGSHVCRGHGGAAVRSRVAQPAQGCRHGMGFRSFGDDLGLPVAYGGFLVHFGVIVVLVGITARMHSSRLPMVI